MFLVVPEPPDRSAGSPMARVRLRDIYLDMRFLRLAPLSTLCIGTAWSLQGLWAAPWLEHVDGLDRNAVVHHLLIMGLALSAGAMLLGWSADRLRRRGVGREAYYAAIAIVFIGAQMLLVFRVPIPSFIPWSIIAAVGAATVMSFAILPEYFPKEMSARANAALNILHLSGAFALQYLTGVIVSCWPLVSGRPPAEAFEAAFGLSVILQLVALLWFLATARMATVPSFSASRASVRQILPTSARHASRPPRYTNAHFAFLQHVAQARVQAAYWRLLGIGSATLCASLAALAALATRPEAIVHVVEAPAFVVAADDRHPPGTGRLVVSVFNVKGTDMR